MFEYFLLLLAAYLIGALPWSDWMLKAGGFEGPGEGSVGPWQVLYYGGPLTALLSLVGEGAKGTAVIFLAGRDGVDGASLFLIIAVVLGQQWSPWLKWQGTGGALALVGGFFPLFAPVAQGIITIYTAILLLTRSRLRASQGVAFGLLPLVACFQPNIYQLFLFAVLALLLIAELRKPVRDCREEQETQWGSSALESNSNFWSSTSGGGSQ